MGSGADSDSDSGDGEEGEGERVGEADEGLGRSLRPRRRVLARSRRTPHILRLTTSGVDSDPKARREKGERRKELA